MDAFKPVGSTNRSKTRGVQMVTALLSGHDVRIDGVIGPQSRRAFDALDDAAKQVVAEYAKMSDVEVSFLTPVTGNRSNLEDFVREVAVKEGVNPDLTVAVIGLESNWDPRARSSTGARGLSQLTSVAIRDVYDHFPDHPAAPNGNQYDVAWNSLTGVRYLKICAGYAGVSSTSSGIEDWAAIYAVYNLGVGAYQDLVRRRYDSPKLVAAWDVQSSELKRGGLSDYLTNVQRKLS